MKRERLEKLDKEKLIGLILDKDETIEHLMKRLEGLEYQGRLYMKGEWYNFYVRRDENS
mgnify:FL=1